MRKWIILTSNRDSGRKCFCCLFSCFKYIKKIHWNKIQLLISSVISKYSRYWHPASLLLGNAGFQLDFGCPDLQNQKFPFAWILRGHCQTFSHDQILPLNKLLITIFFLSFNTFFQFLKLLIRFLWTLLVLENKQGCFLYIGCFLLFLYRVLTFEIIFFYLNVCSEC